MDKKFKKMAILDNILLDGGSRFALSHFANQLITFTHASTSDEETINRLRGCDACITCWTRISERVMHEIPELRYIAVWSHWAGRAVEMEAAKRRDVCVDFLPDYATDSVAEIVFTGILALSRRIMNWHRDASRGSWKYEYVKTGALTCDSLEEIHEHTVRGKTLGILGMGRIGTAIAKIARLGFNMRVLYYSRTRKPFLEDGIGLEFESLDNLFVRSDIITIHVPPDAPRHLIGAQQLALMRDGAFFVNTSVGHVVDQNALLLELKSGRISAYLDVFDGFPPRKDLRSLPNVLFTYRTGWFTQESIEKKSKLLVSRVRQFLGVSEPFCAIKEK